MLIVFKIGHKLVRFKSLIQMCLMW